MEEKFSTQGRSFNTYQKHIIHLLRDCEVWLMAFWNGLSHS